MGRLRWLQDHRTGNPGCLFQSDKYFYIRDTGIYFRSSADGQLDIVSDTTLTLTAPTITLAGSTATTLTGNMTYTGTLTVGVNATGHDVKFFGDTTGKYWLWDESADGIVLVGSQTQTGNSQLTGTLIVGVNDTGHDVKFFGATASSYLEWDESADLLDIVGNATNPGIKLSGAGSKSSADYAAAGTAWADAGTPAFVADMMYARVYIGSTVYRLPLWADA